jgi:hypothetical protein
MRLPNRRIRACCPPVRRNALEQKDFLANMVNCGT